jgi:hypothetical protein
LGNKKQFENSKILCRELYCGIEGVFSVKKQQGAFKKNFLL